MWVFSFRPEAPFLGKFDPKNENCWSKLKFGTQTNSNMQNSVVMFSVFYQKYPFWINLLKKIKIVSLSWNLVPILIWIRRIQRWYSFFPFCTENTFFGANLVQKIRIVGLTNSNIHNSMLMLTFSVFNQKYPFWTNFSSKNQNCQFKLKFGT